MLLRYWRIPVAKNSCASFEPGLSNEREDPKANISSSVCCCFILGAAVWHLGPDEQGGTGGAGWTGWSWGGAGGAGADDEDADDTRGGREEVIAALSITGWSGLGLGREGMYSQLGINGTVQNFLCYGLNLDAYRADEMRYCLI